MLHIKLHQNEYILNASKLHNQIYIENKTEKIFHYYFTCTLFLKCSGTDVIGNIPRELKGGDRSLFDLLVML